MNYMIQKVQFYGILYNAAYENRIPLVFANFCSGGDGVIHLIFAVENINKVTMITRVGSIFPTEFYGSVDELPKSTITTTDGDSYEVIDATNIDNTNSFTKISIKTTESYKYDKNILDVSQYRYLHVYHPNKNYRDWIHLFECE